MNNYTEILHCSKEVKNRILNDCKEEFLKFHPELRGMNITQGQILDQISRFYLKW